MPAQTPAITRSSALGANVRSDMRRHRTARSTRTAPAPTLASSTRTRSPVSISSLSTFRPSPPDAVRQVDLAHLGRSMDPESDVGRDEDVHVADVDAHVDVRLARGQLDAAEVEVERADPEVVLVAQLLGGRGDVVAVADPASQIDVERRHEDRRRRDDECEEGGDRDREPAEQASHAARVLDRELLRVGRRLGPRLARDPEDQPAGDQEEPPRVAVEPQRRAREQDGDRDREEAEADQRPGPVPPVAERRRGDRVLLALVGHDEGRDGVDEDAGPAQEGEDDEPDAEDGGVDVEVAGQPAADAGEHSIGAAALEQPCFRDMCGRFAHGVQDGCARRARPSGMTLSRP